MIYMTPADLAAVHAVVSTESPKWVPKGRNDHLLSMIAETPSRITFGTETHHTVYEKAAALMQETIRLHPFRDGNKRAGLLAGCVLLALNGVRIDLPADADDVALKVAAEPETDHVGWLAKWFEDAVY